MTSAIVKASLVALGVAGASLFAAPAALAFPGLDRGVAAAAEQSLGVEKVWGCGPWGCRGWGGRGYGWGRPYGGYGWGRPYGGYYGGYGWRRPWRGYGYGGGYGWGGGYGGGWGQPYYW